MFKHPILSIAFRPFFLGAILWSIFVILNWMLIQQGVSLFDLSINPMYWHGHEMIYGVVPAVLAGFLFTAGSNWTNTAPLSGKKLFILFLFWAIARILSLTPFSYAYFIFDYLFSMSFFFFIYKLLIKPDQKRNFIFIFLTLLLAFTQTASHVGFILEKNLLTMIGLHIGLNLILIYISVITGRIIPFFVKKSAPSSKLKSWLILDHLCTLSLFFILLASIHGPKSPYLIAFAILSASLHLTRWLAWKPLESLKHPMLLTMYLSYFWIILGLYFMGLREFIGLPRGVALHAQTVGALGGFVFSMVTRVSLGHTGRQIQATGITNLIFICIHLGAIIRVFGPLISMNFYSQYILVSGSLWILASLLFLYKFTPILFKAPPESS